MSQHDYDLANQPGANFRADLNNALAAIVSGNSGATAPSTTFAYMLWNDTTAGVLKRRNAANTGWIVVRTLNESFVLSRSSNTILGVADIGKTIRATGTFTQTFSAASTLGDGWAVGYINEGTGVITLDPNGAETIDGATTITLQPGQSVVIVCNGTNLKTIHNVLGVENLTLTGGVVVVSKDLGTISSGTVTPDPGDRPMQHYDNNGAHTLAPSTNVGNVLVDITNTASAGAITTSGFTKVTGDPFTTTNGEKFSCHISIGDAGSLLQVQAMQ